MPTGVYERKPRPKQTRAPLSEEQKANLSAKLKQFHANKRKRRPVASSAKPPRRRGAHAAATAGPSDSQVAYAFGRIEGWLDAYAEGAGVPRDTLTERVGELLHGKQGR